MVTVFRLDSALTCLMAVLHPNLLGKVTLLSQTHRLISRGRERMGTFCQCCWHTDIAAISLLSIEHFMFTLRHTDLQCNAMWLDVTYTVMAKSFKTPSSKQQIFVKDLLYPYQGVSSKCCVPKGSQQNTDTVNRLTAVNNLNCCVVLCKGF